MLLALATAAPAQAKFDGPYTLTFFKGPDHQQAASYCISFAFTGDIQGFPHSGTFTASGYSHPWAGYYIVDGKDLRWFGVAGRRYITNFHNPIKDGIPGGGGFDEWQNHRGVVTAVGDGITTLVAGCTAPIRAREDGGPPSG